MRRCRRSSRIGTMLALGSEGTMTVQISNILTAKSENIWEFLSEQGQGSYIPACQRRMRGIPTMSIAWSTM